MRTGRGWILQHRPPRKIAPTLGALHSLMRASVLHASEPRCIGHRQAINQHTAHGSKYRASAQAQ